MKLKNKNTLQKKVSPFKRFSFAVIPLCLLLTPCLSLSADEPLADEQRNLFSKLDKNSDGVLEVSEMSPAQKVVFDRLIRQSDANTDGKISRQEFKQATTPEPKQSLNSKLGREQKGKSNRAFNGDKLFTFLDTNKDGKLTRAELPERVKEQFGKLFDKLKKEEVSKAEFMEAAKQFKSQQTSKNLQARKNRSTELFKKLDANKDGKIVMSEVPEKFRPVAQRIFKQASKAPEEGLTLEDLKKAIAKRPNKKPQSKGNKA